MGELGVEEGVDMDVISGLEMLLAERHSWPSFHIAAWCEDK